MPLALLPWLGPTWLLRASPQRPVTSQETATLDRQSLDALLQDLGDDPNRDLKGVVVLRRGTVVGERYFNGDDATTLHDIRSATKSITALLMGIAIDRHLVASVDDPIGTYLPGLPEDGKHHIRIRDLLTMRSGLAADDDDPASPGNEDRLDESEDWVKSLFAVPVKSPPGQTYLYSSLNAFIAGAIIENAAKLPLDEFARRYLFRAIGVERFSWRRVPINRVTGQGNLRITTRDAAAIGQLVLRRGQWQQAQVVSSAWIAESLAGRVPIAQVDPYADAYGYMWYSKEERVGDRPVLVHFASGNGGNKIYVIPSKDMVIAITSSAYGTGYGQRRSQTIMRRILAAAE